MIEVWNDFKPSSSLMPDGQQERQMRRFAGSCRFVFNKALALQKGRYEQGEKKLGYAGLCKLLTEWRNDTETVWLADAPVHPAATDAQGLGAGIFQFLRQAGRLPRFKKKSVGQLPLSRPETDQARSGQRTCVPSQARLAALPQQPGCTGHGEEHHREPVVWQVVCVIQTERELSNRYRKAVRSASTMGVARFATLSDGTFYAPLNSFKRHEMALRKAQRAMSRKVKFSNNWKKAKARVQRIHSRIGNARRDYLHKCSTTISQNHAMVCIEDLQVRNMSKSAAGTTEAPGRNVQAKSGLNKSILDQGWFEFRRQWTTSWRGMAAGSLPCGRSTPVGLVRAATMSRQTTARRRRNSSASNAASRKTPMWSARSMF